VQQLTTDQLQQIMQVVQQQQVAKSASEGGFWAIYFFFFFPHLLFVWSFWNLTQLNNSLLPLRIVCP
jgi:hypothetical protein